MLVQIPSHRREMLNRDGVRPRPEIGQALERSIGDWDKVIVSQRVRSMNRGWSLPLV